MGYLCAQRFGGIGGKRNIHDAWHSCVTACECVCRAADVCRALSSRHGALQRQPLRNPMAQHGRTSRHVVEVGPMSGCSAWYLTSHACSLRVCVPLGCGLDRLEHSQAGLIVRRPCPCHLPIGRHDGHHSRDVPRLSTFGELCGALGRLGYLCAGGGNKAMFVAAADPTMLYMYGPRLGIPRGRRGGAELVSWGLV